MKANRQWPALFGIQPGEGRLVFLFLAFSFFLGTANNYSQTAAFSLFLSRFSAQQLAYVYILNAFIVPILTALYLQVGRKMSLPRLLGLNIGFLLSCLLIFWVGLNVFKADWIVFLLPVLFQVVINFGIMAFWPLANRLFTVRQGKRLFGIIASGQWIAIVISGFSMGALSTALGLVNLLALAVIGLIGALAILWMIFRSYSEQLAPQEEKTAASSQHAATAPAQSHSPWRESYILLIFALVTAWWVGFFLLDNLFYAQAGARYPDPTQLAGFLGFYTSGLGILTLLMNFVLAGRIVSRYGMRTSLLLLPSLLATFTAILAVVGLSGGTILVMFWMVVATKLVDMIFGFSVDRSLQSLLYQPLPANQRGQILTMAEGSFQPFANGLAGLILLGLNLFFKTGVLPLIISALVVSILWFLIAYRLGKEYPRRLVEAISKRRLDLVSLNLADASTVQLLTTSLRQAHPGPVIYAANCLEDVNREALLQAIPDLLRHSSPEIRQNTYERIERLTLEESLPQLREALRSETFPEARQVAIRSLLSFGKPEDLEKGAVYLDHAFPQVRLGAMVGLIRSGGVEGILMAGSRLMQLAQSQQPTDRVYAAQAMGEIGIPQFYRPLEGLLSDADVRVRRTALRAAGQIKSSHLWPLVIAALEDRKVNGAALSAVVSGGNALLPLIRSCFNDGKCSPAVLRRLILACDYLKTPEASAFLRTKIDIPDLEVRGQVLIGLSHNGYRAETSENSLFRKMIKAEAGFSAWLVAGKVDLPVEKYAFMVAVLDEELAHSLDRIFSLLAFIGNRQALMQARQTLASPSPERRSYALEIIDTQLPQELKPFLIPLLDESEAEQKVKRLAPIFPLQHLEPVERLREIACRPLEWNTAWLIASALYTGGMTAAAWLDQAAGCLQSNASPVVQNTLQWLLTWQTGAFSEESGAEMEGVKMFSIVERVMILKKTSLFVETPADALADVAQALEEVNCLAGQVIFEKGEPGNSMYLIASGKVRVFDDKRTFNYLAEGEVFGEMAVLDPEPRSASVVAVEDTVLLKIDQDQLFELIESRLEVARGIIQVLSRHLRHRMQDLNRLQNVLENPIRV